MAGFNLRTIPKFSLLFTCFLALYLFLSIYLFNHYQYDPVSRDLISVMSIAKIYATGDLINAVNGYWGPMFSWLLVPIIYLNPTPQVTLLSTKILSIVIGFFTLIGIGLLSRRFELSTSIRASILFASVFIVLYYVFGYNPVDLLLTCFLIYYLYIIYSSNYPLNWYDGMLCGLLGGLAYLTKSFALPFFLVTFILFNLLHYFRDVKLKKGVLKNLFLGLAVFFIITGSWSGVISEKYGYLTSGTSGEYNFEEIGPVQQGIGSPIWHGFIKLSNEKATSAWEDPTYLKVSSWSPLESWASFKHELNIISDNLIKTITFLNEFSYFSLLIILLSLVFILWQVANSTLKGNRIILPFITIVLFIGSYALIFVEFRYFFLVYFLLTLMGGYLLQLLFKKPYCTMEIKSILLVVFVVSLIVMPLSGLMEHEDDGKAIYDIANTVNYQYHIQGNIASNDGYMASIYVAYLWDSQYYGTSLKNWHTINDSELEKDLQDYDIDYYLYWGDSNYNPDVLVKYREITGGKIKDLKIYSVKEKIQ